MKTVIGISGNQVLESVDYFHGNKVAYTPQNFVDVIHKLGALPVVFPISDPELAADYVRGVDKILIPGGQDVWPLNYGEEPHFLLGQTNPDRDAFELALIAEAMKQGKPILAICRGMQLLNVSAGGTLYQDLSLYENYSVKHLQAPTNEIFPSHSVHIDRDTILGSFLPENYIVNSYHHQAVKEVGMGLRAIAHAKDGVVEALESVDPKKRILAVQWHPEMDWDRREEEEEIFRYFIEEL
jgi:putative glutamine amidotransferase